MKIVTDSGMDIAPGQLDGFDVVQVPLKLELDGKTYLSGVDIQPEEFYELLLTTPSLPITSLPSPGEFADVFRKYAAEGPILMVHISSGLSNTYQSAHSGADLVPEAEVHFIDTMTLSGAEGWQVEAAAHGAKAGWSVDQIKELVKKVRDASETIYTLPDLRYLIHGGRISHMKGLLASVLGIKPLIGVSKTDGKYFERGKSPTFPRALESIAKTITKDIPEGTKIRAQIAHTANPEGAEKLRKAMDKLFDCHWLPNSTVAPVLGAHTGRGLVGVVYARMDRYPALP
jgi:DegV family protein with EDD domain